MSFRPAQQNQSIVTTRYYDLFGRRLAVVNGKVQAPGNALVIRRDIGAGKKVAGVSKMMISGISAREVFVP
ncbi:MAG: hypothetical protein GF401_15455 [Chitinivibrionales bacterium]|nr:hypothetical protein [Chitinivibrionales bacterium]